MWVSGCLGTPCLPPSKCTSCGLTPCCARTPTTPVCSYGPQWEAHVLSNLPFYLTLLPLFLEASVPRVEVRRWGTTALSLASA